MTEHAGVARARHLEHVAVAVAATAADFVREHAGHATTARTKTSPTDVVTHTDVACEQLIRSELLARSPGSTIVGEEFDESRGPSNIGWIVDPIDGTVNFLYDLPVISVSVAATIDGRVVAGAVADVHRRDVFSATLGAGARRDREPIATSTVANLAEALVATGFAYDAATRAEQAEALKRLLPRCRDIRCMGSAALNLCWVACGRVDAYFERHLKPYDWAAGALIAAESGATVVRPSADPNDLVLAATPAIAGPLADLVTAR